MWTYIRGGFCVTQTPDAVPEIKFFAALDADHRRIGNTEKFVAAGLAISRVFSVSVAARAVHFSQESRF
ncbi:MAG TPA: hypothetical protein VKE92_12505, partial [Anaerolineales bacterium]|nr:hypothetical protein [Anaerolineales bacterium]